jgi:large subunit ribosomal protein L17
VASKGEGEFSDTNPKLQTPNPKQLNVMRHGDKQNNLGRKKAHREALLSNLTCQLIEHKRIVTTLAKAKALRVYAEPLITKSKKNETHQRRIVFSYLQDKAAVTELFSTVAEKIAGRPGGYTRVIKLGTRVGDNAEMAMIELVDFNEVYGKANAGKKEGAKRTRRAGGSRKKPTEGTMAATEATATTTDVPVSNETPAADAAPEVTEQQPS